MKAALRSLFVVLMIAVMAAAVGCSSKQAKSDMPSDDDAKRRAEEEALRQRQLEEQRRREAAALAAAKEEIGRMIHFDFDKYDLKPEARSVLQAKAQVLKQYTNLKVVVDRITSYNVCYTKLLRELHLH